MVKQGYGCSFLSKGIVEKAIQEGSVVPVKIRGFNAVRWYYIIYPENEKLTFLANRFMKFLLSKSGSELVVG